MAMNDRVQQLSEKEKETLRLLLRGYDAKTSARRLGLSVHTVNERLRDARRKLSVSSSREAARLLDEAEDSTPESLGDKAFGDAPDSDRPSSSQASDQGTAVNRRMAWVISGGVIMSLVLALYALSSFGTISSGGASFAPSPAAAQAEVEQSARAWLSLVDAGKWNESWSATGAAFRKLNSAKVWASTSDKVRVPIGAVASRSLISSAEVPAPPAGYTMLKFRTDFAGKPGATETLTLVREAGGWKVTGYMIE
jgi:DNA-binding CsgD family transcriptional regulator